MDLPTILLTAAYGVKEYKLKKLELQGSHDLNHFNYIKQYTFNLEKSEKAEKQKEKDENNMQFYLPEMSMLY